MLAAWIWALSWLYGGTPPWSAWQLFGLPMIAFVLCAGLRALGHSRPMTARQGLLLTMGAILLVAGWCGDLGWFPVPGPLASALGREGLRFWLLQLALSGWAGLLLGRTLSRDLRAVEALGLALAAAALAWGGAWALRGGQEVASADLPRIFLDRRADSSGERPLTNLRMRSGAFRSLELQAVVVNDNPYPVWEVELELCVDGMEPLPIRLREDIPAHGSCPLFWSRRFSVEDLPRMPSWSPPVIRKARRHWGGAPRLTASPGPVQSPLP